MVPRQILFFYILFLNYFLSHIGERVGLVQLGEGGGGRSSSLSRSSSALSAGSSSALSGSSSGSTSVWSSFASKVLPDSGKRV